jgi:hypothetical protein
MCCMATTELMHALLPIAVHQCQLNLQHWPWRVLDTAARALHEKIAYAGGEALVVRTEKGESARAFKRLAQAVAILSFQRGGIDFMELHFEWPHPEESPQNARLLLPTEARIARMCGPTRAEAEARAFKRDDERRGF